MSLIALALAASLAGAQESDPNELDLRCVAVFATAINTADEETKAGLVGGVLYFLGRIEGRGADYDVESNLRRAFGGPDATSMIETNRERCYGLLGQKGMELIEMGESLQGQ